MAGHYLTLLGSPHPRSSYQLKEKAKPPYIDKVFLPNPIERNITYSQVVSSRESRREFSAPLKLPELSSVLWDVLKIKKIDVDPEGTIIWSHRGAPSAGGLASVETFILNIADLKSSLYHYNPYDHSLEELACAEECIKSLIDNANMLVDAKNATLFIYVAEVTNLFSKYENPESLLWRDVGAIYAMVNLSAESVGINSCALGLTFHPLLSDIPGFQESFFSVGGQVLGCR